MFQKGMKVIEEGHPPDLFRSISWLNRDYALRHMTVRLQPRDRLPWAT